jgi:hypothetical protein
MTAPLVSTSIAAPGFYGLNTQESSITLESGYALVADNTIIDKYGRLGARKGWRYVTSGSTGINLEGAHRFVGIDGVERILSWSDTKFYVGISTLTEITPTTDNTLTTGNWQAATLNDQCFFFQRGYKPMVYDPSAGTITDVEDEATYSGTVPQANTVLSAYGRLWVADTANDKMVVYWSDLLDGASWGSGSAGSIDLTAVMVQGTDEIVGLGAQNGQLLIFCRRAIVIFADSTNNGTLDPATLSLVEVINRVGCVARDSIQNTGVDIFFISEDGLKSLGRVIQEKSLPMRDLSANVRDEFVRAVATENKNNLKTVYSEDNAFYLVLLPSLQRIYTFDTRAPLPNGALRVTVWDTQAQTNLLSLPNDVYFTQANGLAQYFGYQDNGEAYRVKYYTNYFDFGAPTQTKILKRISVTVIGGSAQDFVLKSGFDYTDAYQSYPAQLTAKAVSEYGVAEYGLSNTTVAGSQGASTVTVEGSPDVHYTVDFETTQSATYNTPYKVWLDADTYYYTTNDGSRTRVTLYTQSEDYAAEYTTGTLSEPIRLPAGGSGNVLQIGFEANVNGAELSIQKMDIFIKQGRVF